MAATTFENLNVWKKACRMAVRTYRLLKSCPDVSLRDQMQRAALSVPSNIAEGSERGGKDFDRFLRIAQGSCAELRTQCYIAQRIDIMDNSSLIQICKETKEVSRMIQGLRRALKRKTRDQRRTRV